MRRSLRFALALAGLVLSTASAALAQGARPQDPPRPPPPREGGPGSDLDSSPGDRAGVDEDRPRPRRPERNRQNAPDDQQGRQDGPQGSRWQRDNHGDSRGPSPARSPITRGRTPDDGNVDARPDSQGERRIEIERRIVDRDGSRRDQVRERIRNLRRRIHQLRREIRELAARELQDGRPPPFADRGGPGRFPPRRFQGPLDGRFNDRGFSSRPPFDRPRARPFDDRDTDPRAGPGPDRFRPMPDRDGERFDDRRPGPGPGPADPSDRAPNARPRRDRGAPDMNRPGPDPDEDDQDRPPPRRSRPRDN